MVEKGFFDAVGAAEDKGFIFSGSNHLEVGEQGSYSLLRIE